MLVHADISTLKETHWYEYALRFAFGGGMTVCAGLVAKHYGPGMGGLFLAFPAIAPAAATLLDQHAKEKQQRAGFEGHRRGRKTAALDMFGTLWGTVGLLAFALVVWQMGPSHRAWLVLSSAMFAWFAAALATWSTRRIWKHPLKSHTSAHELKPAARNSRR